jgi:hypothetical protein
VKFHSLAFEAYVVRKETGYAYTVLIDTKTNCYLATGIYFVRASYERVKMILICKRSEERYLLYGTRPGSIFSVFQSRQEDHSSHEDSISLSCLFAVMNSD